MEMPLVVAVLIVSYVATHLLVVYLQRLRIRRIEKKAAALCAADSVDEAARVPITLVTGFLGSGKTTLVRQHHRSIGRHAADCYCAEVCPPCRAAGQPHPRVARPWLARAGHRE